MGISSAEEPTMAMADQPEGSWKPIFSLQLASSQDTPYSVPSASLTQLTNPALPSRSKVPCGTATTFKPLLSSRNCSTARTSSSEKSPPMMIPRGGGLSVSSKAVSVSLLYEVMMAEYVKLELICFSMASAISLWRPMQMRGIGCDMAMSDVEERRGLKIAPGSVGAREREIDGNS